MGTFKNTMTTTSPAAGAAPDDRTPDANNVRAGREYFLQPISSRAQAEQFCMSLERDGFAFHFDDPLDEIVNMHSGARTFNDAEAGALRQRVSELFEHMEGDPYNIAVACTNAQGGPLYRIDWLRGYGENDGKWGYFTRDSLKEEHGLTESELTGLSPSVMAVGDSIPMVPPMTAAGDLATITRIQ